MTRLHRFVLTLCLAVPLALIYDKLTDNPLWLDVVCGLVIGVSCATLVRTLTTRG